MAGFKAETFQENFGLIYDDVCEGVPKVSQFFNCKVFVS